MGKSNKPTKWFKAVKKAFRSPSKERPLSPGHQDTVDDDERLLAKHDLSPASHQTPTPHPLPSFEIITHDEVEPYNRGQPLASPEIVNPTISANAPVKELQNVIEEEDTSNIVDVQVVAKHQDDDDDSTLSEEEEAAARIQQRFSAPLALEGLIRLQALVRGHQVRRQAATTLQTMEAIVRVQAVFRGRRVRMSKDGRAVRSRISKRRRLNSRAGTYGGNASREGIHNKAPQSSRGEEANIRKRPTAYRLTQQLKRSAPNRSSLFIDCDPGQPHWGWAWLELWSNARPWEIREVEDSTMGAKASKGSKDSKESKDSKDYIEIIPSRKNSEYTTKEVDVNTLKVKYYEDYISNPTPAKPHSSEKRKPVKSSSPMSEKKEPVRSSRHLSEKREPVRSPMSEKKEHGKPSSSPMSEKRESVRSSSSPFSEKKEKLTAQKEKPVVSSTPVSEKEERVTDSSQLCEKNEPDCVLAPDWQQATMPSPVRTPGSPSGSSTPRTQRTVSKPPPIEVPTRPGVEEPRPVTPEPSTPKSPTREKSIPPSPAVSEGSIPIPPSPQASDASLPVPETPPGLDPAAEDPSVTMEHLMLPEAHSDNGGETNGGVTRETRSSSFSASNGEHQPEDDTLSGKDSASDVVIGHATNGDNKLRKGEKVGENGASPVPSKRPACRYMAATQSAKAKFRSNSNPKTRSPDTPESPVRITKRYSIGGAAGSKGTDSPKTAFGTRKTNSFQIRGTPSPKAGTPKEKPRTAETGTESPARRNSLGGADGKRWRT